MLWCFSMVRNGFHHLSANYFRDVFVTTALHTGSNCYIIFELETLF